MTCHRIAGAIVCTRSRRRRQAPKPLPCRWPGCTRRATHSSWGCRAHFFKLTPSLRDALWRADRDDRAAYGRLGRAWDEAAGRADRHVAEILNRPPAPTWRQPELPL
ncbi:hypothetical protein [Sphingosinicella sp. CPCC 101087]|uniref:hypothetical protein n=1 Tax=Sphingosinicella sp. CPCC 101087 TaxID=2497754 RepID=UPI00101B60D0|nr:hypothetical protein [Sphingosinicella sp. CPCC 101087]